MFRASCRANSSILLIRGRNRNKFLRSKSLSKVVASLALSGAGIATVDAATGIRNILDVLDLIGLIFGSDHRHRQFALCAIASFHDLRDPQTAVLCWYIRLMSICRRFHRRQCWWWLMLQ